jgi:ADP-ribose pyrophosphatase YjhB (NUDIX family)
VFVVPVTQEGKIVLMRDIDRGWGIIGGHRDNQETIVGTLMRESGEEGGLEPENPELFATMKITAEKPVLHQDENKEYPFPVSFMVYYISGVKGDVIGKPTEQDSVEAKAFTLEEIEEMEIADFLIIKLGYETYCKTNNNI